MACPSYENYTYSDWNDIFGNEYEKLWKAGIEIENRIIEWKVLMENQEVGWAYMINSTAPGHCCALLQFSLYTFNKLEQKLNYIRTQSFEHNTNKPRIYSIKSK